MAADGSWLWRRLKQLFGAGVAIAVLLALIRHLQSAHRPPLLLKPPEATGPRTTPRRRRATRNFESSPIALAGAEQSESPSAEEQPEAAEDQPEAAAAAAGQDEVLDALAGTWRCVEDVGFEEQLTAMGVNWVKRKLARAILGTPTYIFSVSVDAEIRTQCAEHSSYDMVLKPH